MNRFNVFLLFIASSPLVLPGCAQQGHSVIAATGTTIGVEVGQSGAGGLTGVLGYRRAEFALVPSNRPSSEHDEKIKAPSGADQTGDVIMELRYTGFSEAGIYQRLAVGKNAVSQPGAQIMFARDAKGQIDADTAEALAAVTGIQVTENTVRIKLDRITTAYRAADAATQRRFDQKVNEITGGAYSSLEQAVLDAKNIQPDQAEAIERGLEQEGLL